MMVDEFLPVIGQTMRPVVRRIGAFAAQDETLLIGGPTGAGKSRLARWCHERSARRGRPFECLSLLAVPEELQLAEIVGWKRGAFTGATRDTSGAVARANHGTLFIDEIDKLSLRAQAGLLQILDERSYRVLGDDSRVHYADVRFIVATNADLAAAVSSGRFREDLYYRINVLPVSVPPLCARREEIIPWARELLSRRHRDAEGVEREALLDPAAEILLEDRPWHGNLRELDNVIRRAYALAVMGHGEPHRSEARATVTSARATRERRTLDPETRGPLVLGPAHVESALDCETNALGRGASDEPRLVEALRTAAEAFVNEACARKRRGQPLDLDVTSAFRGMVLDVAARRFGPEGALLLFGRERLVANRNHHKLLRRELERAHGALASFEPSGTARPAPRVAPVVETARPVGGSEAATSAEDSRPSSPLTPLTGNAR